LSALAYAVSYPAAIAGIIGTLLTLKALFRIDPIKEAEAFAAEQRRGAEPLERRTLIVENPNLEGVEVEAIPGRLETGVTVSRIRRADESEVRLAIGSTVLRSAEPDRSALAVCGVGHYGPTLAVSRRVCAYHAEDELHGAQRLAGRQHDRSTSARVRFEHQPLRCSDGFLRYRVSADHGAVYLVGPDPRASPMRMSA
jgi:hypothetical protein